jgi:hypothetical protein
MDQPHKFKSKDVSVEAEETCKKWNEYSDHHVVEQIDSGLRMMEKE